MKNFKIWPIFIVVFLNMLGFGIIIPVIRDLTELLVNNSNYNSSYYAVFSGILMASYSLFQLIFSPIFGRISDIYGRKIVLIISVIGNIISYIMWAISHHYLFFLLSRIISGITGANLSVAQSYIADITDEKNRAKYMGTLGAIFGIGFILGPFFGGVLSTININHIFGDRIIFNRFGLIGLFTAGLSFINLLWIIFGVRETVVYKESKAEEGITGKDFQIKNKHGRLYRFLAIGMISNGHVRRLILIYFLMQLGFNHIEAVLAWDLKDRFGLNASSTGYFFAYMGIVLALVQGGIYRVLLKKFSLINLSQVGAVSLVAGFLLMPISYPLAIASLSIVVLAFGMGISSPSIMTLTSILTNKNEQGVTMGILQSFGSLSRVIAPLTATIAYDTVQHSTPYLISSVALFACWFLITGLKKDKIVQSK